MVVARVAPSLSNNSSVWLVALVCHIYVGENVCVVVSVGLVIGGFSGDNCLCYYTTFSCGKRDCCWNAILGVCVGCGFGGNCCVDGGSGIGLVTVSVEVAAAVVG